MILACAATSGAAVMVVELTAVRALEPFFGSTTPVWTNVIAVALGALAVGYEFGGRFADRAARPSVLFALLASAGALTAAAAVAATPVARLFLGDDPEFDAMASLRWKGSLGACLLVLAPPLALLGAASPFAVRLLAAGGTGSAAGRVFALATAASVAGAYLASPVLVPAIGSRATLVATAAVVLGVAATGFAHLAMRAAAAAIAALALGCAAWAAFGDLSPGRGLPALGNGGVARVIEERETPYQYVAVREDRFPSGEVDRVLTINEAVRTFHSLDVEGRVLSGSRHYDDYAALPLLLEPEEGRELRLGIVGFACGVNAAQWRHFWDGWFRLSVEGAEIDPFVLALGRAHFGLGDARGVVTGDGRAWLASLPRGRRFDVLVVDAFASEIYMPFHLGTREFLELAKSRLRPGGILAMNVFASGADAPHLLALENTLATVFGAAVRSSRYRGQGFLLLGACDAPPPDVSLLGVDRAAARFGERPGTAEWEDLLTLAGEIAADAAVALPRDDLPVLTDDHAPIERMTDAFVRRVEQEFVARRAGTAAGRDLATAAARQDRLLAATAAAWAAVLAAAAFLVARMRPR